jgi:type IV pilus assembly protein PilP
MKQLKLLLALALPALAIFAIACGDDPEPVAVVTPPPKPRPAAPAADAADAGAIVPAIAYQYAYNPLGKRDPFRAYEEAPRGGEGEGPALCNEPLCQWDLDQLALRAVVSGDANPLAMAEDPNGVGHMIRRNTKVGKQGGKVTQILRDCMVVTEYWTGPDGKVNPNPVKVCIKADNVTAPLIDLMNPQKKY